MSYLIFIGPSGCGKTYQINRYKPYRSFPIHNVSEMKKYLNIFMVYTSKQYVHLDIRSYRVLKLYEFTKILEALKCGILIEVRHDKHIKKISKKNVYRMELPTKEEKSTFLKRHDKKSIIDVDMCRTYSDILNEIEKSSYPDYEPYDYRRHEPIDLKSIVKNKVGLKAIQYERTTAKHIFIDKIKEVIR